LLTLATENERKKHRCKAPQVRCFVSGRGIENGYEWSSGHGSSPEAGHWREPDLQMEKPQPTAVGKENSPIVAVEDHQALLRRIRELETERDILKKPWAFSAVRPEAVV
jgi:hypothetical protein